MDWCRQVSSHYLNQGWPSSMTPYVVTRQRVKLIVNFTYHVYRAWLPNLFVNSLRGRHNGRDSDSNHQPHDCLLNRLSRRRAKKTPKLRVTGRCVGNSPATGEFPHKWPVTRIMFPFDDVTMVWINPTWLTKSKGLRLKTQGVSGNASQRVCLGILIFWLLTSWWLCHNGPLTRYAKLRIAHAPGMPGTFPRHCRVRYPDMHHETCVTHVPWCMPGSLSSSFLWCRWRGNVPGIPGACATLNFTYLVRGQCKSALSQSYDAMHDEKKLIGSRSHSLAVGAATVAPWSFVDKKWAYTCVHERL